MLKRKINAQKLVHFKLLSYLCNRKRNKNKLNPKTRKGAEIMKLSTAKKNVEILTKMQELAMDLEEMPTGDLDHAISEGLAEMKTQLRWSLVYHLSEDNHTDKVLFEGSDADCADYIIDHPELKGHCIISPNY